MKIEPTPNERAFLKAYSKYLQPKYATDVYDVANELGYTVMSVRTIIGKLKRQKLINEDGSVRDDLVK